MISVNEEERDIEKPNWDMRALNASKAAQVMSNWVVL